MIHREAIIAAWETLLAAPSDPKEHNDLDFPTRESALTEIKRLKQQNQRRYYAIMIILIDHFYSKPTKGRPKPVFEIMRSGNRIEIKPIEKPTKRKTGRPLKMSLEERKNLLREVNAMRVREASAHGNKAVKAITDKALVTKMVDDVCKALPAYKKQKLVQRFCRELKYSRDEASMPQKRKTPK